MKSLQILGIDLGGTNLRAGIVVNGIIQSFVSQALHSHGTRTQVLEQIFGVIDKIINNDIAAIGIGIPGLVDPTTRILYDVVNVPALNGVDLLMILEQRYNIPVQIENDANCFTLGEFHFGAGLPYESIVGLTIGTGLGAGIVINGKLFTGKHGGAGEFGMIKYLDKNIEYYVSGRFFEHVYQTTGEIVFQRAIMEDAEAIEMYEDFGRHLGEAIKMILCSLDCECILIGGSAKTAFSFYSKSMWDTVNGFAYKRAVSALSIEPSILLNANILGAAALHFTVDRRK
ncbi:ROK family protein [Pedobacter borealis]|uniref:ROK family protein n=1 Tax=Pedobacter borealis TaxID=475254 RepID=UPI000493736F|nr:ROK family protein [Pedobacter borealis]